jgi:hypothetical protein
MKNRRLRWTKFRVTRIWNPGFLESRLAAAFRNSDWPGVVWAANELLKGEPCA